MAVAHDQTVAAPVTLLGVALHVVLHFRPDGLGQEPLRASPKRLFEQTFAHEACLLRGFDFDDLVVGCFHGGFCVLANLHTVATQRPPHPQLPAISPRSAPQTLIAPGSTFGEQATPRARRFESDTRCDNRRRARGKAALALQRHAPRRVLTFGKSVNRFAQPHITARVPNAREIFFRIRLTGYRVGHPTSLSLPPTARALRRPRDLHAQRQGLRHSRALRVPQSLESAKRRAALSSESDCTFATASETATMPLVSCP